MGTSIRITSCVVLAAALFVSGCGRTKRPDLPAPAVAISQAIPETPLQLQLRGKRGKDIVAPGFEVQITSAEDERLNGTFRVAFNGNLKLPYDVTVAADGATEKGLRDKVVQAYKSYFQGEPSLQISVLSREYWVEVAGLVTKPGLYLVKEESTIDEVLALAGGIATASEDSARGAQYVRVEGGGRAVVMKLSDYYAGELRFRNSWGGGERVFVQRDRGGAGTPTGVEPNYVKIIGEVRSPGEYIARDNGDFLQYLIRAGGPTDRAGLRRVSLIRATETGNQVFTFNANNPEEMPRIFGGDVIIVNADTPTEGERDVQFAGGIAAIISSLATIVILAATL